MKNKTFNSLRDALSKEDLVFKLSSLLKKYFRVQHFNIENVPLKGRALIVPNHSGVMGLDAVVLKNILRSEYNRDPYLFAHRFYFDLNQIIKKIAQKFSLTPASFKAGIEVLEEEKLLMLFPEAEAGNFKSSLQKYRLQKFHTGFVRFSILTKSPIIPTLIIGAEEANYNAGNLNLERFVKRLRVPLPINAIPLPSKWQIHFLKPIYIQSDEPKLAYDPDFLKSQAEDIRQIMQLELSKLLKKRKNPYL